MAQLVKTYFGLATVNSKTADGITISSGVKTWDGVDNTTTPSATNAYWTGGDIVGTAVTTTSGLNFATDTTTMVTKGVLSVSKTFHTGCASSTVGYCAGGYTGGSGVATNTSNGLTFATDTTTQVTKGTLTVARYGLAAAASSSIGYFTGGTLIVTYQVVTDGLSFASDTTTQVTKAILTQATYELAGANSSTVAYFSGGQTLSGAETRTNGLVFATDTIAMVTKGALSQARLGLAGANSSTLAYFSGGDSTGSGSKVSTTDGLTFSTDTTTMVTKGALTAARYDLKGTQSATVGYFAGGNTNAVVATTDGLTFASDTTAQVTKGSLSTGYEAMASYAG